MHFRGAVGVVAGFLLVLAAAGCGGAEEGSGGGASSAGQSAPVADFNEADVRFASEMILHHQQAVQLASMAGYQARSAQVKQLAAAVGAAQEPEIKTMATWLAGWGKPAPQQAHGHDEELPGMMTHDELHDLGEVPGAAFDRAWAQWMIKHHQGAIAMAKAQQSAGSSPAAVALAKKIELTRTKQLTTLRQHTSNR